MLNQDIVDFEQRTIFKLKHVKELIEVCLYKSYFIWNQKIHGLKDSGPIGLSLMVVLAESFLQMIENKSLSIARSLPIPVTPKTHKRYVDDTHDRFDTIDQSESFLEILNNQEPRIKFTAEYENDEKQLNYLDTTIINSKEGNYKFKLYRKDAITNIQVKPNSCHDEKVKIGIFKGYISRARSICSEEYLNEEIEFIVNIFVENGYDRKLLQNIVNNKNKSKPNNDQVRKPYVSLPWIPGINKKLRKSFENAGYTVSFKSPSNLKQILTIRNKPKLPPNSQPGVYLVPCECESNYTGRTKKRISTRNKEHEKDVFVQTNDKSALVEHSKLCDKTIQWSNTKTLAIETNFFRRCVREALEIRRHKSGPDDEHGINQDYGQYVKTNTWNSLLHHKKVMDSTRAIIETTTMPITSNTEAMLVSTSNTNGNEPE